MSMTEHAHSSTQRPLIDARHWELAGRTVRQWLERFRAAPQETVDTSIAWEDGELDPDRPRDRSHR